MFSMFVGKIDTLTGFRLLSMQCKRTFTKRLILSTLQRKCPMSRRPSQKCDSLAEIASRVYYDNLHNKLYTDFKIRIILFKETLPRSLKKAALHFT